MAAGKKWQLTGDYFETCSCDVVCPCLISAASPLTARPTQGVCDVALAFHIEKGRYDGTPLDDLNVVVAGHVPGAMADGGWTLAVYFDERADERQSAALEAIFSGTEGGPMAAFAPLVGTHLGIKKVPILYSVQGKTRSAEIPSVMQMSVDPLPTMHPGGEIWTSAGHPVAPDRLALAVGGTGSTFADHGMRWNNSGKNGHYAPISWSS